MYLRKRVYLFEIKEGRNTKRKISGVYE